MWWCEYLRFHSDSLDEGSSSLVKELHQVRYVTGSLRMEQDAASLATPLVSTCTSFRQIEAGAM